MSVVSTDLPAGYLLSHATMGSRRFIETSGEINEFMKMHVINLAERGLHQAGRRLFGAKVAVMGLAYKKNINDPRESPAIKIIEELVNLGARVRVYDPFVPSLATKAGVFVSAGSVEEALSGAECAVFLVDHDMFRGISLDMVKGLMASPVVVDGKICLMAGERGSCIWGLGKVRDRMFRKGLFILAHQCGDTSFYPTYKKLVKNQWKPYAELKHDQEKQLRHLVEFSYETSRIIAISLRALGSCPGIYGL